MISTLYSFFANNIYVTLLVLFIVLWLLHEIFKHRHIKGYTSTGLEIQTVDHTDQKYFIPPFAPIRMSDDLPTDLFNSFSQEVFICVKCGKKVVEHH